MHALYGISGAVVASTVDAAGGVPVLTPYSLDGQALGTGLECPDLSAVHETSLGATFACSDGLVFAAEPDAEAADATPVLTRVEYPATDGAGAAPPTSLDSRPHRPAVAGPAVGRPGAHGQGGWWGWWGCEWWGWWGWGWCCEWWGWR